MPSNEQRREAAKRKLERQLERRAERARKRKQMTIAGTALGVVVVVGVVGGLIWLSNRSDDDANTTNTAADDSSLTPQTAGAMPAGLSTPLADTVSCSYPADGATASKANNPPRTDGIPTTAPDATPSISVETSQGNIGLTLDGTKSPCTVNSFVSLAQQDYFNDTTCHRMTTSPSLQVLQCGDPSGTGTGSVRKVTVWTALSQVKGLSASGGDMQFANITAIDDVVAKQVPTIRNAVSMNIDVYDDPTLAWYSDVATASDARAPYGLLMAFPNGSKLVANAYWSLQRVPAVTINEAMTSQISLSYAAEPVRYAS